MEDVGLQHYASIARSDTTADILRAWGVDPRKGFARYEAAAEVSGVKPPDTDLIAWGSIMGFDEASAYGNVERMLEDAIVSGALVPGASGWKARAAALCDHVLGQPAPHAAAQSWLGLVTSERITSWVETGHPDGLRAWRAAVADRLHVVAEPPNELEPVIGPMRWLLEICREGVMLTQSGYLPPAMVSHAIERFDWWDWPGRPRSRTDVHQLVALREAAAHLRLVTKRGRRLTTSKLGIRLLEDRVALWRTLASSFAADEYATALSELIAHRLLDGPATGDDLSETIVPIIASQGWQSGGEPLDRQRITWSIHDRLYDWRLFGLLDEVRPPSDNKRPTGPNITSLSTAGRATALAFLHARATGPRTSLRT